MRDCRLGKHSAEMDEQGILTLYGAEGRMVLASDEAYALLSWLHENHRDTLYRLTHADQEPEQQRTKTIPPGAIAVPEEGQGDDYAF
ncbi:MAG: hypothetical protein PVS3B3_10810 [Ktedonobacteraceae bacterium]